MFWDRHNDIALWWPMGLGALVCLVIIGVLVVLVRIDWRLAALLGLFLVLCAVAMNAPGRIAQRRWHLQRRATAEEFGTLEELLSGTEDIRANGATSWAISTYMRRAWVSYVTFRRAQLVSNAGWASALVLYGWATAACLALATWLFDRHLLTVGGVTVDNPVAFSYTWNEAFYFRGKWDGGSFAAGPIFLDGDHALDYARTRYTSVKSESTDFARSVRQQRVLAALRGKLGGGGLSSLGPGLSIMDALKGLMKTDLSAIDLYLLSSHLAADRRIELTEGVVIKAAFNSAGQYVLLVIGRSSPTDYAPLQAYLQTKLAQPIATPSPSPSPSIP